MAKSSKNELSVRGEGGTTLSASFHEGPLPPPEDLRVYAEIRPDFPERLLGMSERHHAYIIESHKAITGRNHFCRVLGQVLAFAMFLCACALAVAAFLGGFPWASLGVAIIGAACIVAINRRT